MNQEKIKSIANNITHDDIGVFEDLFEPLIFCYLNRLTAIIEHFEKQCPGIQCNRDRIFKSLGTSVLNSFINVSIRTLIAKLYREKDCLCGSSPEERYRYFVDQYLVGKLDEIIPKESELDRIISNKIELSLSFIREFLERFAKDVDALSDLVGGPIFALRNIETGEGDTHNHGRSVLTIEVNEGDRLVYKPHPLDTDIIMSGIQDWLNSNSRVKFKLRHPKVICRDNYGWQEFVVFRACEGPDEAERYMYRMGSMIFIAYLTRCTDLHFGNLLANGEYPIVIDTEIILYNSTSFQGLFDTEMDNWEHMIEDSVFTTLLLPFRVVRKKRKNDFDFSGIFGGVKQADDRTIIAPVLINKGTDEIRFARQKIIRDSDQERNTAVLNNQRLNAGDYLEYLIDGFRDAYESMLSSKSGFCAMVESLPMDRAVYRQVLRHTDLYCRYLDASYHPDHLINADSRRAVYEHLKGRKGYLSEDHQNIVAMEIQQLLNDDIPYLYAKYDSLALYSVYGDCIENFYKSTVRQQFTERIQKLDDIDLYRQIYFIRCAIANENYDSHRNLSLRIPAETLSGSHAKALADAFIKWIYRFREEEHRVPSNSETAPGYYTMFYDFGLHKIEEEGAILYTGIGSVLFYMQLYRQYGLVGLDVIQLLIEKYSKTEDDLSSRHISQFGLFDGMGSKIYLNYYCYKLYKDTRYLDRMNGLCDQLISRIGEVEDEYFDVISGYSGVIIFAIRAWEKDPHLSKLYTLAEICTAHMYKMYAEKKIPSASGIAHGYAGPVTAFFAMSKYVNKEEYYAAAVSLLKEEQVLLREKGWLPQQEVIMGTDAWCFGLAGILVSRAIAIEYADEKEIPGLQKEIDLCLYYLQIIIKKQMGLQALCHGGAGSLDVLLWYARKTCNAQLLDFVDSETAKFLDRIWEDGILYEYPAKVIDASFMNGLSGIGYYLQRYFDAEIPSVLAFEAF